MKNNYDKTDFICAIFSIIATIVTILATILSIPLCSTSTYKNMIDDNQIIYGRSVMENIGNGLWYDTTTRIGYIKNHQGSISPYIAPNGLPFRYNPETKALEQIKQ